MYKYKQLKMGKHELPTWDGMIPVILEVIQQQSQWRIRDLAMAASDSIGLPQSLRQLTYPKYPDDKIIENRVNWAISDLTIAGLLQRPSRGIYQITELGKSLSAKYGLQLTTKIIHDQPMYVTHQEELKRRKKSEVSIDDDDESETPEMAKIERIQYQIEAYNAEIAADLIERIRAADPGFFEQLVADLLTRMGYQGPNGKVVVTPPTNDGGIDGIINQDPLGTSTVYFQAKRYQANNIVQRPAIQAFFGALSSVHADRGVFISTSSFSKGAREQAKSFSIVLIDGVQLTDLLLKYHVGVQAKKNYDLFQIDEDYF